METEREDQPIIIVNKKVSHGGHHGGSWKVAYADFVTSMMAFFLVMWLVAQSDDIKGAIGGYFRNPVGFADKTGSSIVSSGSGIAPRMVPPSQSSTNQTAAAQEERDRLTEKGEELVKELMESPAFESLRDNVMVEITDEGLRIQLIESEGERSGFFGIGSAKLSVMGAQVLGIIAKVLRTIDNDVILEGHTDSLQYTREDYSNWELSSDRANTARRLLTGRGVFGARVKEIRAYADKMPRADLDPGDPRNRRVSILVVNQFSEAFIKDYGVQIRHATPGKIIEFPPEIPAALSDNQ